MITNKPKKKICCICKETKPLTEFYKAQSRKDGHQTSCKICSKKYRQSEISKIAKKRYDQSEKGKIIHKIAQKHFRIRHPERRKAMDAVKIAVRAGKLPHSDTLQCHYCGVQAEQYHHYLGYAPQHYLDVVPACRKCDRKDHLKIAI